MPRFTSQYEGDTALLDDGDPGFVGVNNRLSPSLLKTGARFSDVNQELATPGLLSDAMNVRCASGEAETRPGAVEVPAFNPPGAWPENLVGVGEWRDPDSLQERTLAAAPESVWVLGEGQSPARVPLPPGQRLESAEFVTAFSSVLLFRGTGADPLVWDGDLLGAGFVPVADADPDNDAAPEFLESIPAAAWGTEVANRVIVPTGGDRLAVSGILDFTRYDSGLDVFRVNDGDGGSIVATAKWRRDKVIVFKERSLYALNGLAAGLEGVTIETLHTRLGCLARRTVADVGGDIFWLAREGVFRLSESVEDSLVAEVRPVSEDIEATMGRINWTAAGGACAATAGRYYYLAVPLGRATRNNAVLVYDTVTRRWQGTDHFGAEAASLAPVAAAAPADADLPVTGSGEAGPDPSATATAGTGGTGPLFYLDRLVTATLWGRRRAFAADLSAGRIVALDAGGDFDRVGGTQYDIIARRRTRGYLLGDPGAGKRLRSWAAAVATRGATITLTTVGDGPGERADIVSALSADPLASLMWGRAPYDPATAADGEPDAADRADYAVTAGQGTRLGTGFHTALRQTSTHSRPARDRGRYFALELVSTTGHAALQSVHLDAIATGNDQKSLS